MAIPVILIFDIGKTNKKLLLFDEQYKPVHEETVQLKEATDEDGFPCEDISKLTDWIKQTFDRIISDERFEVQAVNFSAYGASFVYLDKNGKIIAPLYNYLKPFPGKLQQQFYETYGGETLLAAKTASPVLGSLNSGLQLYRLKNEQPQLFAQIDCALHLPQYLGYILSQKKATDITSIGCHTHLWDFEKSNYHEWVRKEKLEEKFAPIIKSNFAFDVLISSKKISIGIGLHDSSAALIPYLAAFKEPFVLISTGTWCISLNPFNHSQLSINELQQDCLCYLSYEGKPVKASRLFAGFEHEQQVKKLAVHFNVAENYFSNITYDSAVIQQLVNKIKFAEPGQQSQSLKIQFAQRDLSNFSDYSEAYHCLLLDIITAQKNSTALVLKNSNAKKIFVDGGFSKNEVYMNLLAASFPGYKVCAAQVAQASALGAAMVLYEQWNKNLMKPNCIELKNYYA